MREIFFFKGGVSKPIYLKTPIISESTDGKLSIIRQNWFSNGSFFISKRIFYQISFIFKRIANFFWILFYNNFMKQNKESNNQTYKLRKKWNK